MLSTHLALFAGVSRTHLPEERTSLQKNLCKSTLFPLKFCSHRWVENVIVAERAAQIWPQVNQFVGAAKAGAVSKPKNKSFKAVADSVNNPLFIPQLQAFIAMAKDTTPFLLKYQTDAPMLPFVKGDLENLLRDLMRRFIKKDVLENADTVGKLLQIDPYKKKLHVQSTAVDIGFAAEQALRWLKTSKKISDRDILSLRLDCK